jgi:hypothetical protein
MLAPSPVIVYDQGTDTPDGTGYVLYRPPTALNDS